MKFATLLVCALLAVTAITAQLQAQPDIIWTKGYGDMDLDQPSAVVPTADDGCLAIGSSRQGGARVMSGWVLKLDSAGEIEWKALYQANMDVYLKDGLVRDGGYMLMGLTAKNILWILLIDEKGGVEKSWYSEQQPLIQYPTFIPIHSEGLMYVASASDERVTWATLYNQNAEIVWANAYKTEAPHTPYGFGLASNGDLLAGGMMWNFGGNVQQQVGMIHRISKDGGQLMWTQKYQGLKNSFIHFVTGLADGRILAKGSKVVDGQANPDQWTLIADENGNEQENIYAVNYFKGSLAVILDEGFIPTDYTSITRFDPEMNVVWSVPFAEQGCALVDVRPAGEGYYAFFSNPANRGDWGMMLLGKDGMFGSPKWAPFEEVVSWEDDFVVIESANIMNHLTDRDTPIEEIEIAFKNSEICEVDWDGEMLFISPLNDFWGYDSIEITATDPDMNSASVWIKVNFRSVNDSPSHFDLRFPQDSIYLDDPLILFAWDEAEQNEYETDSVTYQLEFKVQASVHQFDVQSDRTLMVEDLLKLVDDLGYGNGDPVGWIEWWVTARDSEFDVESTQRFYLSIDRILAAKENQTLTPVTFGISAAFPNPFNSSTTISYGIDRAGLTRVDVVDMSGRTIATLTDAIQSAGSYSVTWNASSIPAGVYLVRLTDSSSRVQVKKVAVVK